MDKKRKTLKKIVKKSNFKKIQKHKIHNFRKSLQQMHPHHKLVYFWAGIILLLFILFIIFLNLNKG